MHTNVSPPQRIPAWWTATHPAFAGISDTDDLLRQVLDDGAAHVLLPALADLAAIDCRAADALVRAATPRLLIRAALRGSTKARDR